jgi:hypothetical protein
METHFDGGDSRTLLFSTSTNQAITGSRTDINASPAGPAPLVGCDVSHAAVSVNEGDSGTRSLVFTITLNRAVHRC